MALYIVWVLIILVFIWCWKKAYANSIMLEKIELAKKQLTQMEAELDAAERERRPFRWPFPPQELVQLPNPG